MPHLDPQTEGSKPGGDLARGAGKGHLTQSRYWRLSASLGGDTSGCLGLPWQFMCSQRCFPGSACLEGGPGELWCLLLLGLDHQEQQAVVSSICFASCQRWCVQGSELTAWKSRSCSVGSFSSRCSCNAVKCLLNC